MPSYPPTSFEEFQKARAKGLLSKVQKGMVPWPSPCQAGRHPERSLSTWKWREILTYREEDLSVEHSAHPPIFPEIPAAKLSILDEICFYFTLAPASNNPDTSSIRKPSITGDAALLDSLDSLDQEMYSQRISAALKTPTNHLVYDLHPSDGVGTVCISVASQYLLITLPTIVANST